MKQIFYNGIIITMDGEKICNSFSVENGYFTVIGEDIKEFKNSNAELINLEGKTVMPAFIDAHSHLSSYANSFLQAQLNNAASFEDIIDSLILFAKKTNVKLGEWIIASGYDHNVLKEKAHPTKELLDKAFPDIAVVLQHQSRHFGVFNTMALSKIGFEGMDNDGYIEEKEFVEALKKIPMPDPEHMLNAYKKAMDSYASYGITTIQEGMMAIQMMPLYKMLLKNNLLYLDVVGYPQISDGDAYFKAFPKCIESYDSHFRLGGYKIFLDGSPQGRTAWMKMNYKGTDSFGVSTMSDEEVAGAVKKAVVDGRQLLAHCNGDAAAEQFIFAAKQIEDIEEFKKIRPVIIHGQLLSKDQLPRVKQLGIIPSFFVAHCYYWGDTHIRNFGFERASEISPIKSALENNILFTLHQDTPVILPNMLETVWCAVMRKTKSGVILGKNEQISVYDALKAVTINAAYQYGEEKSKGSISTGKQADFIVLSENPLEVPPERLKEIAVLETYKSGLCIYKLN